MAKDENKPMEFMVKMADSGPRGSKKRTVKIDPEDFLAIGFLVLCVGCVATTLLVIALWGLGKVSGDTAGWLIPLLIGGDTLTGVLGVLKYKGKKRK